MDKNEMYKKEYIVGSIATSDKEKHEIFVFVMFFQFYVLQYNSFSCIYIFVLIHKMTFYYFLIL